ncbi:MAG: hypothetical protein N4A40_13360 [Tissierellales bacterium]|jgi:hypothetical protein|nr:hypothetical protein [Tissierellales bacterium]
MNINIDYFVRKKYKIPNNISIKSEYKYLKVINNRNVVYLDIIMQCGGFAMQKQFQKLVHKVSGTGRTEESSRKVTSGIINELLADGFIGENRINQNKVIYLKKPAFALTVGDYKTSKRITLSRDFKNDKLRISLLKLEMFIMNEQLINSKTMMYQLKLVTKHIKKAIISNDNKYRYDLDILNRILNLEDYKEIKNLLMEYPERNNKLGIIRGIWIDVADIYRKMILQRESIFLSPEYYKLFTSNEGEITIHYIPHILIFDVGRDNEYFKNKSMKLFKMFFEIENNDLNKVRLNYENSFGKNMGNDFENHIGYVLSIIGEDENVLQEKKKAFDEVTGNSLDTPVMRECNIIPLHTAEYLYHSSRKGNSYSKSHDARIDSILNKKFKDIENEGIRKANKQCIEM